MERYVNAQAAAANGVVEDGHLPQITNPNTGEAQPVPKAPEPKPEPKPEQAKHSPSPIGEPSR